MVRRFIDLSLLLESNISEPEPVVIDRISHREGAKILTQGRSFGPDAFPLGLGVNLERVHMTSHSGTHVDAPLHYGPNCQKKEACSIDKMPLDWFFGDGVVLDCSQGNSLAPITEKEIKDSLINQQIEISEKDIVFIYTGADKLWGTPEYFSTFRGVSVIACEFLLNLGVRVIGVDTFGFDPPFFKMLDAYEKSGCEKDLWPCHMLGRSREYCQIERLTNLGSLPKRRKFTVSCFPIKLEGCGAAPCRVVAIIDEGKI